MIIIPMVLVKLIIKLNKYLIFIYRNKKYHDILILNLILKQLLFLRTIISTEGIYNDVLNFIRI